MKKMTAAELKVPFLRSCKKEISTPVTGEITGTIPTWLDGHLLRIGPGILEIGSDHYEHLFDALALIRKFSIHDGKVTYQNNFVLSDTYKKNIGAGKIVANDTRKRSSFTKPPSKIFNKFQKFHKQEHYTDNDLIVNIVKFSNEIYACGDSNYLWKLDPENLHSQKKVDLRHYVPIMAISAHTHKDRNGCAYIFGTSTGKNSKKSAYVIIELPQKTSADSEALADGKIIGKIPMHKPLSPTFCHSFAMTENYFIFVEQPFHIDVPQLVDRWSNPKTPFEECTKWKPHHKTRFHVMRRGDGTLVKTKYTADAFLVFHHINAYEDDNHIILDLCAYPNNNIFKALYVDAIRKYAPSIEYESLPKRFILPLKSDGKKFENLVHAPRSLATAFIEPDGSIQCYPEALCEAEWYAELPTINYKNFNSQKYRYFYAVARKKNTSQTSILKVDVEERGILRWFEEHTIASEPVFVPTSQRSTQEDDGILLVSLLFNDDDRKVALLILSAETMKEVGRATFHVDASIPGDYHGTFISKDT